MKLFSLAVLTLCPLLASAQLAVTVSPPKVTGNKAVVSLAMKNNFNEKIQSARAVVFLLDGQGKVVGQSTKWVVGGSQGKPGLSANATSAYNFVITGSQSFTETNLTVKVSFNRVLLDGGRQIDPASSVQIQERAK